LLSLDLDILCPQCINQSRVIRCHRSELRTILLFAADSVFHNGDSLDFLILHQANKLRITDFLLGGRSRGIIVNYGNRDNNNQQIKADIPKKFIQAIALLSLDDKHIFTE
jgi:hypothetical protein